MGCSTSHNLGESMSIAPGSGLRGLALSLVVGVTFLVGCSSQASTSSAESAPAPPPPSINSPSPSAAPSSPSTTTTYKEPPVRRITINGKLTSCDRAFVGGGWYCWNGKIIPSSQNQPDWFCPYRGDTCNPKPNPLSPRPRAAYGGGVPAQPPGSSGLDTSTDDGFDPDNCTFDGVPLYGSVYFASSPASADITVYFTSSVSADLDVYEASSSLSASSCGRWYPTRSPVSADLKVYVTRSPSADISVREVSYSTGAGT